MAGTICKLGTLLLPSPEIRTDSSQFPRPDFKALAAREGKTG